ncbi:hypothetical protein FHS14_001236 [Paenibacillus baekrokdamisoli]|nr:hypothetical protein [Paenibacillus baekrokdamisoli]
MLKTFTIKRFQQDFRYFMIFLRFFKDFRRNSHKFVVLLTLPKFFMSNYILFLLVDCHGVSSLIGVFSYCT